MISSAIFKIFFFKRALKYLTIFRDPLDWFASHYYSKYHGTLANPKNETHCKHCFETEKFLGLESCFTNTDFDCEYNKWNYLEYAGGTFLSTHKNGEKAAIAAENYRIDAAKKAKQNLMDNTVFFAGILEEIEQTMEMFNYYLPAYFSGAVEYFDGKHEAEHTFKMRDSARAANKPDDWREQLSPEALGRMEDMLKHELDVYQLAKALLHKKHRWFKGGDFRRGFMEKVKNNKFLAAIV